MVPSARGDSLCCCLQQHFPLPLLCVYMGSCRKCPLCRDSAPSPTALDKPRNVPLSYFLLLPWQLTENIDSATRLENPTYWNSENQVCNSKSSTSYRDITSLFLSLSTLSLSVCHLGSTAVEMYWGEQGRRGAQCSKHLATDCPKRHKALSGGQSLFRMAKENDPCCYSHCGMESSGRSN